MRSVVFFCAIVVCSSVLAGFENFTTGPVIDGHGPAAKIAAATVPAAATFKIALDVSEAAETGKKSRALESAARLLNMHAQAGLPVDATRVAIVVHGAASIDLVTAERYGGDNPSQALVAALIDAGVSIQLCGQTAAYRDIDQDDLLPGVTISVSAMTAHALLQQAGYTLNPF